MHGINRNRLSNHRICVGKIFSGISIPRRKMSNMTNTAVAMNSVGHRVISQVRIIHVWAPSFRNSFKSYCHLLPLSLIVSSCPFKISSIWPCCSEASPHIVTMEEILTFSKSFIEFLLACDIGGDDNEASGSIKRGAERLIVATHRSYT